VIGAELHLDVKTVLWQETTTWQEGSDSVAGNGDVPPAPVSRALPSQQGSVSAAPKAHFRIGTWVARRTKLCPLLSSQDSTFRHMTFFPALFWEHSKASRCPS